jgi:hypothetical protein
VKFWRRWRSADFARLEFVNGFFGNEPVTARFEGPDAPLLTEATHPGDAVAEFGSGFGNGEKVSHHVFSLRK